MTVGESGDARARLWAEVAIFAALAFVTWVTIHGLLHGLLDPTWTGQEMLIVFAAVGWLSIRYHRRRRARSAAPAVCTTVKEAIGG